jgi:hypothetical protein
MNNQSRVHAQVPGPIGNLAQDLFGVAPQHATANVVVAEIIDRLFLSPRLEVQFPKMDDGFGCPGPRPCKFARTCSSNKHARR